MRHHVPKRFIACSPNGGIKRKDTFVSLIAVVRNPKIRFAYRLPATLRILIGSGMGMDFFLLE